jgi:hypothetical protein
MRNILDKFAEKIKTYSLYSITSFFENRTVEIMWKVIVEPDRPHMTIWRMRIECKITKAASMHSEYVALIVFLL